MECHSDPMQTPSSANSAVVDGTISRIPVEYEVEGCPKLASSSSVMLCESNYYV